MRGFSVAHASANNLRQVMNAGNLPEQWTTAAKEAVSVATDLRKVSYDRFVQHATLGLKVIQEQTSAVVAQWLAGILRGIDALKACMPDYHPHVVQKWDETWIRTELLAKQKATEWQQYAARWVQVTKLHSMVADAFQARAWHHRFPGSFCIHGEKYKK